MANIIGTPNNDVLNGTPAADLIQGLGGSDILDGGADNDYLQGDGDDPIAGGNDTLNGGTGDDLLEGWGGDDTLYGGDGDDDMNGDFSFDVRWRKRQVVSAVRATTGSTEDAASISWPVVQATTPTTSTMPGDVVRGSERGRHRCSALGSYVHAGTEHRESHPGGTVRIRHAGHQRHRQRVGQHADGSGRRQCPVPG